MSKWLTVAERRWSRTRWCLPSTASTPTSVELDLEDDRLPDASASNTRLSGATLSGFAALCVNRAPGRSRATPRAP